MNDDRDPRVFFAAERTLLAWIRTAIAVMGLGFVVARFGLFLRTIAAATNQTGTTPRVNWESTVLGVAFVLLGAATLGVAAWQHRAFTSELSPAEIPRSSLLGYSLWFAWLLALLGVALAGWLAWSS